MPEYISKIIYPVTGQKKSNVRQHADIPESRLTHGHAINGFLPAMIYPDIEG
ncbi:MAG: hypothetical protein KGI54_11870 [Pseudomonadota bacterium]|nr:hypothetical protein [Pseudomonadota bacterium]